MFIFRFKWNQILTLLRVASNFLVVLYRREWAALGNMSKEDAMVEFVKLLNRCCHLFSTYVASHKIEKEEQEKKRWSLRAQNTWFCAACLLRSILMLLLYGVCVLSQVSYLPLGPHFLWQLLKTFWCEQVLLLRVLKGEGLLLLSGYTFKRNHPFIMAAFLLCYCTKFLSKHSKLSHPSSYTLVFTHPLLLPLVFLEYSYSISWLSAVLHGMPYVGITYWLWLPDSSLITSRDCRGCYWMHCLCLWDFLSWLWIQQNYS